MSSSSPSTIRDTLSTISAWQWAGGVAVSTAIVAALVAWVGGESLWQTMQLARPLPLTAAILAYLGVVVTRWVRLAGLLAPNLDELELPPGLLWTTAGHSFSNQWMPFRSGELLFPVLLRRAEGTSLAEGAVYLAAMRLVELGCLIPLYGLGWVVWFAGRGGSDPLGPTLYLVVGSAVVLLLALPVLLRTGLMLVETILHHPRLRDLDWLEWPREALVDAEEALEHIGPTGTAWLVATSTLMWVLMFVVFHMVLVTFGAGTTWAQSIVGSGGGIVGNFLPINGLGSLGTKEAGWLAAFRATGAPEDPVLAAGFLLHGIVIVGTGLATLVGVLIDPGGE